MAKQSSVYVSACLIFLGLRPYISVAQSCSSCPVTTAQYCTSVCGSVAQSIDTCKYNSNGGCPNNYIPTSGTCCCIASPIVIDVTGGGFKLTSAANGVVFDIGVTGHPVRTAWTAPGSGNAWLVLDRNGNGLIDDASEMFGNKTDQPEPKPGEDKNGFAALAVFDRPENGGNRDGLIDANDAVFSRLRLWQDDNHNGRSEAGELHTLPEAGVPID